MNIKKFYMVLTLHMCVLYRYQKKKTTTFALYSKRLVGYNGGRRWMMCSIINLPKSTVLIRCCRKLAKTTIIFVSQSDCLSVCLSVCLLSVRPPARNNSDCKDLHEIWYLRIFRKSVEKIRVKLNKDKNNGYFTWKPTYTYDNIYLNSS